MPAYLARLGLPLERQPSAPRSEPPHPRILVSKLGLVWAMTAVA